MEHIPYGRQFISEQDIKDVCEVLRSDFLTQGPKVIDFEDAVASFVGAKHALAVNSATSALHIACLALGVGKGDMVWTSPNTFVATANCALYCGADIDFVDIDLESYNMCPRKLEEKLIVGQKEGRLPKVVIPVHFSGQSCDMKSIYRLGQKYGFKIIEDASHAMGGKYCGSYVGDCRYSDISIFSFHPVKIMTTAEGGLATTNDFELLQKMKLYSSHMITRDESLMEQDKTGMWYYEQIGLGYNYRMTEIQAALGISQLKRVNEFVERRQFLAKRYDQLLESIEVINPIQNEEMYSAFHLYVIQTESRKEVFDYLRSKQIGVNVHYIPVHTQPYYKKLGFSHGDFTNAEEYYSKAITLPLHPQLTEHQQDFIVSTLKEVV